MTCYEGLVCYLWTQTFTLNDSTNQTLKVYMVPGMLSVCRSRVSSSCSSQSLMLPVTFKVSGLNSCFVLKGFGDNELLD